MTGKWLSGILSALFIGGLLLPPLLLGVPFSASPVPAPTAATVFILPLWEQILLFATAFIVNGGFRWGTGVANKLTSVS